MQTEKPVVNNYDIYNRATGILHGIYGPEARFKQGQYEAIEATLTNKRTLVVQKTGWGKSLVYFIATKILCENGRGLTLVISPLLALMDDQVEAAKRAGLTCITLNHTVEDDDREHTLQNLASYDMVFTTPETLFADDMQKAIAETRIGLLVVDEAHCISDWGHDFRLEYSRLRSFVEKWPSVPLLATTATATKRVVDDLCVQLGGDVFVSRGPLARETLAIQVVDTRSKAEKLAWLAANIGRMPGTGIVYCTTKRDCDAVAGFLGSCGIQALPYHTGVPAQEQAQALQLFNSNQIKAIVATTKLGMGYDKGDVAFVVHFQMPSNIVAYYQQIGRAGRDIENAYAILLYGDDRDLDIQNHFINSAFPSKEEELSVLKEVEDCTESGVRLGALKAALNMRRNRIEKAIDFLEEDGFIYRETTNEQGKPVTRYYRTSAQFVYDEEKYKRITQIRQRELEQMVQLAQSRECYSRIATTALDDESAHDCGRCSNCTGADVFDMADLNTCLDVAQRYLVSRPIAIEPRKMWVQTSITQKAAKIPHPNEEGICLCRYGWGGLGTLVQEGKYPPPGKQKGYGEALLARSVEVLQGFVVEHGIQALTCVPSLNSNIVADFAKRLAAQLGLPFVDAFEKTPAQPQKEMESSNFQCLNAQRSLHLKEGLQVPSAVLLVDDMVDSRWTLTVCGNLLCEAGCEHVYPFALADSSNG